MVVFGLVLLVLALAVFGYMWMATRGLDAAQISYGFLNVDASPFWMFVAGGITLAAATCGLWLIAVGARVKARKAKEVRALRKQASSQGAATTAGTTSPSSARPSGSPTGSTGTSTARSSDQPILPRPDQGRQNTLDVDR